MARRVALARAIVMDRRLIYDDLCVGLDPVSHGISCSDQASNDALGITSIVVSHDVAEVGASPITVPAGRRPAWRRHHQPSSPRRPFGAAFMRGSSDGPVSFPLSGGDYVTALLAADGGSRVIAALRTIGAVSRFPAAGARPPAVRPCAGPASSSGRSTTAGPLADHHHAVRA